jgi:CTP-dependent riboflavin kinase
MGHPTSKAKKLRRQRAPRAGNYKSTARDSGFRGLKAPRRSAAVVAAKAATYKAMTYKAGSYKQKPIKVRAAKRLDIFLYGNVMSGHGEGGYYIGCV